MSWTRIGAIAAAATLALGASTALVSAAPGGGAGSGGGKCVSEAIQRARADGMTPAEAARAAGFANPGAWLSWIRDTCGGPIEEPPGM
jgi:hypothetical protein